MTQQEVQAAARARLDEQTRQSQQAAREAQQAAEQAKYQRDCATARRS